MKQSKGGSVRWRIVLIYFMLVFIAMSIVSVFLMSRMESYQLDQLRDNISRTVSRSNLLNSLGYYEDLQESAADIQKTLDESWSGGFAQEISVVTRSLDIVASTNPSIAGRSATEVFDTDIIISCLISGRDGEADSVSAGIPVKSFCYLITPAEGGISGGVVFVRADLSDIDSFLGESRMIFIQAIILALMITVLLGFELARSITVPINSVTESVEKMSTGDFGVSVPVRSDDEIGQLAEMFNLLREKLDLTISEINNEKNKLGTILRYMADGLVAIDLQGSIIHVNPEAMQILGIAKGTELEGRSYQEIMGCLDSELALDKIAAGSAEGGGQGVFSYGGGTYILRYDRFKDETGEDIGIIIIMQDITERQKLEDMQTDFVANVSHELKTPLTNIKSYTETLLDGAMEDPQTASRFLGIVNSEADRMNNLVRDLLQLSRLDHKQEPINLKESNIVVLVNLAVMKIEMTARQKGLWLHSNFDVESDIRVNLDRDRMEQVLMNVLSNAIKYTNEGGVDVYIDESDTDKTVSIRIADTGIGIPKESLDRIYERFYRVDKARSRAMGGTGLGLAITKQIVDEHSGTIVTESEEGKGTSVTITLPLANRRGVRNIE